MKIITLTLLHKRITTLICLFALVFSSTCAYAHYPHEYKYTSLTLKDTTTINTKYTNPLNLTILKIQDATTTGICCDGKAKAIASGGKPGYTYQWSASANNQTTATASLLTNRTHSVTVTDADGTQVTKSIVIKCLNTCDIKATNTITHVSCNGDATGSVNLTVENGTPPFTFAWSNGSSNEDLTNVVAGTYSVTITDALNCTTTSSATITEPSKAVSASVKELTHISCNGSGQITVEGIGGVPPYTYSIDNGANYQTSETFLDLAPGRYTIKIRDANCCTSIVCTTILFNCTDAVTDINNTFINTPVSGNVLTNDEDLEGDTQTVTTTTVTTIEGVNVNIEPNTGVYTYTPPTGFTGEDSFEYTICDDGNPIACDTATVYIEVLPISDPKNEAPIANPDTAITEINTPVNGNVLVNDFDPDGDPIIVTTPTVTTTEGITVAIDPNTGIYSYTPPLDFTGDDTFEYTICDNGNPALCDTTIVVITVIKNQNNSTFANDDAYFTACKNIQGNVLDNDFDPEGDTQTINIAPVDDVDNGTLTLNTNGSFTYIPNSGYTGTDSFIYTVCDNGSPIVACDRATVYITISAIVPPNITNCNVTDETIECNGTTNETIANTWNANNIAELESCASDTCNTDFTGQITSNYDFNNLVSSCGLGGAIEVTYTITSDNGDTTTLTATLTLHDSTPPDLTSCTITDLTLECSTTNIEEIANQWNSDNIALLETCATDNCNVSTTALVTSDYDFNNITDGILIVEYTITDDCNNATTVQATITFENNSVTANDTTLCALDEIESQIFDLFDLLEGEYRTGGTWEVISGNASIVDDHFFDPLSIELFGEDASEEIAFSYTENNLACPIYLETTIEVHNRCAVFSCGEDTIKISKVITPNGDPYNEYFAVNGVENCGYVVDVKIINRWGAIIYKSSDYQNDWNGTAHQSSLGSANQVPSGTYYCIVTINNSGLKPISTPLYIGTK
ncbi:gliding motility-associated-like protein [Aquimarina sp. EL_43]|uniref:Ig-like domain-containing protein n=1 Tax=unclassified Aquimarina TaxID=2627091 RepID=UPI0018CBCC58|nr:MULTISPECIES: Ig-like domain-containing protein [unclassified Aquimarina]MBG6132096.1 gliding motility-associated-like protein [Aquimarina sp. EL_35]MBG6152893.1 gliding motility-associated-like protein [Aquimarina sp. EL_32]MBG6170900.1 gliding motility-associated-like protein [Aquimarina sp. EL_43]